MSDFDAYRTPAALPETPMLSGDDLMLARGLTALYYGILLYLVYVLTAVGFLVADLAAVGDDEWTALTYGQNTLSGITWALHALGGFFFFVGGRSGSLQALAIGTMAGFIAGGLWPYLIQNPDGHLAGSIAPDVVSSLGGTAACLALREIAAPRIAAAVQRAALASLGLLWIATGLSLLCMWASTDPAGIGPGYWTLWLLWLLACLGDGICFWLAVSWTREELLRPPIEPDDEGIHFDPPTAGPLAGR